MKPQKLHEAYTSLTPPQVIHSLFPIAMHWRIWVPNMRFLFTLQKLCLGVKAQGPLDRTFGYFAKNCWKRTVWKEHYINFNSCTINFDIHKIFKFLLPQAQSSWFSCVGTKKKKGSKLRLYIATHVVTIIHIFIWAEMSSSFKRPICDINILN